MSHHPLVWIGLAGVSINDNARARRWQQRLHGVMILVALLSLPAYVFEAAATSPRLQQISRLLDLLMFAAFLAETLWMMYVSSFPVRYLFENWLNVLILVAVAASAAGAPTDWLALVRLARVVVSSLILLRALAEFRVLFTRRGAPMLLGVAVFSMLAGGGVFYWLEPSIHSYWDGIWLAFVTGATIGYGDFVPTVGASRIVAVLIAFVGVAMMTLFTANLVAFFVGHDDAPVAEVQRTLDAMRQEMQGRSGGKADDDTSSLQQEIAALRSELAALRDELRAMPAGHAERSRRHSGGS